MDDHLRVNGETTNGESVLPPPSAKELEITLATTEVTSTTVVPPPQFSLPPDDQAILDGRASPSKFVHEREDDHDEAPAAKRTRTDLSDDLGPEYKVLELPKTSDNDSVLPPNDDHHIDPIVGEASVADLAADMGGETAGVDDAAVIAGATEMAVDTDPSEPAHVNRAAAVVADPMTELAHNTEPVIPDTNRTAMDPEATVPNPVERGLHHAEVNSTDNDAQAAVPDSPLTGEAREAETNLANIDANATASDAMVGKVDGPPVHSTEKDVTPTAPDSVLGETQTAAMAPTTTAEDTIIASELPAPAPTGITKAQHKFLLSGVRNLRRTKDAPAFNHPVDPVKLNIPTYPDVVKHPMDLATMEDRLKNNGYTSVEDYKNDFYQIVQNSVLFNGPEHVVTQQARNLQATFERQLGNLPGTDAVELGPPAKKARRSGAAPKVATAAAITAAAAAARRESRSSLGGGSARSPSSPHTATTTFALGPSGTPLIRRDSAVGDGRPKREIHPPPPRDLPYAAAKPKKKKFQWELKFAQETITDLLKPKYASIAHPFHVAVDPVALNIPHYHKVVKKPMDLGTIDAKLKNGQYENAKEVEADVRLMFGNCYRFNPPSDPIHQMGKQLESHFDEKWATKRRWIDDHAPASSRPTPSTSSEPDDDDDDDDGDDDDDDDDDDEEDEEDEEDEDDDDDDDDEKASALKVLRKQVAGITKQMELIAKQGAPPARGGKMKRKRGKTGKAGKTVKKASKKKKKDQGTAGPATATADRKKRKVKAKNKSTTSTKTGSSGKKDRTPYVTYEQKQEISTRINTLPPTRMSAALRIIRDNMPNLKVGGTRPGPTRTWWFVRIARLIRVSRAFRTKSSNSTSTSCLTRCCINSITSSANTHPVRSRPRSRSNRLVPRPAPLLVRLDRSRRRINP